MFELSNTPLTPLDVEPVHAGGFVTFEGRVRSRSQGRPVVSLEYEAYPELAVTEGIRLVQEAIERFGLVWAKVVHRVGHLQIGDAAVWIGVASAHRREAFAACEWIIDEIKHRIPIWKKEHYAEGDSGWVGSEPIQSLVQGQEEFVASQQLVTGVGADGLERLRQGRALVVGAGPLGCSALPCLVGAGIGRVTIVDPGLVETGGLPQQPLYKFDEVGRNRADRAAAFASRLSPFINAVSVPEPLSPELASRLVLDHDVIIDSSQDWKSTSALDSVCRRESRPLVIGRAQGRRGCLGTIRPDSLCLSCFRSHVEKALSSSGSETPTPTLTASMGSLMASEALNWLLPVRDGLATSALVFDETELTLTRRSLVSRKDCEDCRNQSL